MTIFTRAALLLAAVTMLVTVPTDAMAVPDTVLQVVAVKVNPGKLDAYTQKVSKLNAVMERLGVKGSVRMWQATVAGEATGTVVVGLEFPNLGAYAEATTKMSADKEWSQLLASLDDIRTIVSTSLYREITP